jgi:hypothetical protein
MNKDGILSGCEYGILQAVEHTEEDGVIFRMVQLRNPWGHTRSDWVGPYSNRDTAGWARQGLRKACCKQDFEDDGTFWVRVRLPTVLLPSASHLRLTVPQ